MKHYAINLPIKNKGAVLAFGAQSKISFCFVKRGVASCFELGGDLGSLDGLCIFEDRIKEIGFNPDIVACDLHPEYISTKLAKDMAGKNGIKLVSVQHHEAHVASCIADNDIKGKVIGVAFDGTGFGTDGNIWGCEFFTRDVNGFRREAHLKYIPMPGGETCVKEPCRMALSYLHRAGINTKKFNLIAQAMDKGINSPLTSSMGRLFDAVSSLIGICDIAEYEGQAAIELEKAIGGTRDEGREANARPYRFSIKKEKDIFIISPDMVIKGIIRDIDKGLYKGVISLKFHNAVCKMIKDVCNLLKKKYKINKIVLTGGVFQNKYLASRTKPMLEKDGFKVYGHNKVPAHDGGIALGQAVIALNVN